MFHVPPVRNKTMTSRSLASSVPASFGLYVIIMGLIIYVSYAGAQSIGYNWQWYRVPQFFYKVDTYGFSWGDIPRGLVGTIVIASLSFVISIAMGSLIASMRLSNLIVGRAFSNVFIEMIRNLPLLVLLYLCYYVLGPIFGLDRFVASVLCLALFQSAQISEVFRAGVVAIAKGQWEAAHTVGLTIYETYRFVVLPQAVRLMLPPLTGEAIHMIKNSAIVSVIAVVELTTIGRNIISDTYMSFEIWFTIAVVYLVVTVILSAFVSYLENRLAVGRT